MHDEYTKDFFVNDTYSNQTNFLCPNCRSSFMRQERVEVFDGIHVLVDSGEVTVNTDMTGNPSAQKDGLFIWFRCEDCDKPSALTIAQHKGVTLVNAVTQEFLDEETKRIGETPVFQ